MIRKLKAEEIECRIAQCFDGKCTALLYKTARVDRAILDETFGHKWQNDFKEIDGKMYGGIGIYDDSIKEWLWRWDCGTESNTEKEKGEASDCFKRAGFKWGIGIELYSSPQIWLNIPTKKNDKGKFEPVNKYDKYNVSLINYDENGNINQLEIVNKNNEVLFSFKNKTAKPETGHKSAKKEILGSEVNSDFDLIEDLKTKNDMRSLVKIYNENKRNVIDIDSYNKVFKEKRKEIMERK